MFSSIWIKGNATKIQHIASHIACLSCSGFRLKTVASSSARPMGFSSATGGVLLIMKSHTSDLCVFAAVDSNMFVETVGWQVSVAILKHF